MDLGINDILLHYESLGDIDYKITITLFLITKYIQATTGTTEAYAKKRALAMRDPLAGWAMVMDDDERFYEWCKRRFYGKAMSKRSKNRQYSMFWLDDKGEIQRHDFCTKYSAFLAYDRKAEKDTPVLLFVQQSNGELRSSPIRKHHAKSLMPTVEEMLMQERLEDVSSEASLCRKTRQIRKCEDCLRFMTCKTINRKE